jgi:hypothetical protein
LGFHRDRRYCRVVVSSPRDGLIITHPRTTNNWSSAAPLPGNLLVRRGVIHLKTAKQIRLTIPQNVLTRADKMIN